jgi:hypothetical protein
MGIDLKEMGFKELGYVARPRKRFLRDEGPSWK